MLQPRPAAPMARGPWTLALASIFSTGFRRDVGVVMVFQEHVPRISWHTPTLGLFVAVAVESGDRLRAAAYIHACICRIAHKIENLAVTGRDPFDLTSVAAVRNDWHLEHFVDQMQVQLANAGKSPEVV